MDVYLHVPELATKAWGFSIFLKSQKKHGINLQGDWIPLTNNSKQFLVVVLVKVLH